MVDPNLLVGYDSSDDACVYGINDQTAVIQTVDFFTPIVDDPYLFGQLGHAAHGVYVAKQHVAGLRHVHRDAAGDLRHHAAAGAAVAEAEGALNAATGYKEIKAAISERDQAKAHYDSVSEKNKGKLAGVSANAVVNSKAQFHHGGSLGASAGFMGIKKPYMIIRRPKQMIPDMYGAFNGYPTNTYVKLDDLIGYTRVSDIRLNIPDATVDEILECERLLKEGVVL